MKANICFLFLSLFFSSNFFGQQNVAIQSNDDVNIQTLGLLKQSDSISITDSVYKSIIRAQMLRLNSMEKEKYLALENELKRITQADSIKAAKLHKEIDSLRMITKGYPVIVYEDTLFNVFNGIGSITSSERAKIISTRLSEIYHDFNVRKDSLIIVQNTESADLFFEDKIIASITPNDALWLQKEMFVIAQEYQKIITTDILKFKKERTLFGIFKEVGLTLLVFVVLFFLIRLVNYLFRTKVNPYIEARKSHWFKGVKIRNYEIIEPSQQISVIYFLAKITRYFFIALLFYISLPIVFSIFPPTRSIAEALFGYILSPVKKIVISFVNYIPELITIAVIITISRYFLKFLKYISGEIAREELKIPGFFPDWAKPTYNILKVFVIAFTFIVIFPKLPGSDSEIFKGVTVFLGIVFSLGSSSIISNMIAGLVITYMRPFKIGDRIKIGEVTGDVVEKTPFVTRLETAKKEYITIPNSNILATNVVNYSTSREREGIILHTTVTIGYDVPWRQVHDLLLSAANKTQHLSFENPPFVLQTSLDDFYVSYQLNAYTREPKLQPAIYSELHQNIQDSFNEAGIEILSPHYRAARDGNTMGIPSDYIPKDYIPGSFRIKKEK